MRRQNNVKSQGGDFSVIILRKIKRFLNSKEALAIEPGALILHPVNLSAAQEV
jgi:hypothetical protein